MKILINAMILAENNTGLGNYTSQILEYICPLLEEKKYEIDILCANKNYLPINCQKYCKEIHFKNYIDRNIKINKIPLKDYDIIWSTTQHGILKKNINQIVTVHDLTPLIYPKGRKHQFIYYKYILPKILKKSKYIITVSKNTKNDILKYYKNIDENKIKVVYESILPVYKQNISNEQKNEILNKNKLNSHNYFCIIGIHYYYKNIHSIVEMYNKYRNELKDKVVIIGNKNNEYGQYLETLVKKYDLEKYFIFTGYISNIEKNVLVDNCTAILYPTKYEGFGLPVIEAMDLGIPVVCSNTSSLPEIAGEAALYFNPDNIDDIYDKIMKITGNEKLRDELIKKGFIVRKKFDWNIFAKEILEIINNSIKK